MILKILGALDILSAMLLWLGHFFHIIPQNIMILIAFYLLIKGVVFLISADIASILDIICAGIIFLSFQVSMPGFVMILATLFLLQKGILSWMS